MAERPRPRPRPRRHVSFLDKPIITPLYFINSLNQGFVWGNSPYDKLWDHLDNREKHDLRLTKRCFSMYAVEDSWYFNGDWPYKLANLKPRWVLPGKTSYQTPSCNKLKVTKVSDISPVLTSIQLWHKSWNWSLLIL